MLNLKLMVTVFIRINVTCLLVYTEYIALSKYYQNMSLSPVDKRQCVIRDYFFHRSPATLPRLILNVYDQIALPEALECLIWQNMGHHTYRKIRGLLSIDLRWG